MLGRTHIVIGLFIALVFSFFVNENPLIFIVLGILGSLLPDIDSSTSYLGKGTGLIPDLFSHRGFIHSIYALVIFSGMVYVSLGQIFSIVFAVAFLSHLLFDSITKQGISFFMIGKRIKGHFISGGLVDKILFWSFTALDLYLLIFMF